jgi:ABC-type histidine transport system ATPase subunit
MTTEVLRIEQLSKSYGRLQVLNDISCSLIRGEVVSIIGPSGSGKSTLLRCTALLEPIDAGRICLNREEIGLERDVNGKRRPVKNNDVAAVRRRIGMVFQNFNLFPHKTVLENVMEGPLVVLRQDRRACQERADQLLARVGIYEKRHDYVTRLSGGQQQRAAIARALAMQPEIMLFDEPTSALDPELKGEVLAVIRELCVGGMTSIIATHEMRFAREVSNQILMFDNGRIIERGEPGEFFDAPKTARARDFLQRVL